MTTDETTAERERCLAAVRIVAKVTQANMLGDPMVAEMMSKSFTLISKLILTGGSVEEMIYGSGGYEP